MFNWVFLSMDVHGVLTVSYGLLVELSLCLTGS